MQFAAASVLIPDVSKITKGFPTAPTSQLGAEEISNSPRCSGVYFFNTWPNGLGMRNRGDRVSRSNADASCHGREGIYHARMRIPIALLIGIEPEPIRFDATLRR